MTTNTVRITGIRIENFKNVESGYLSFENHRKDYKASVVGLYGQNGSGKTALIDAIELLVHALCGRSIPDKFADYVKIGADTATLTFEFRVELPTGAQQVAYQFSVGSVAGDSEQNTGFASTGRRKFCVVHELIKCPILSDKQTKTGRLIDTSGDEVFSPKSKRILLTGKESDVTTDLLVAKKLCLSSSRSFAFSRELLTVIRNKVKAEKENEELDYYSTIIESLVNFGNYHLFVINTANSGLISLNTQPFVFKYEDSTIGAVGTMMLHLNGPVVIHKEEKSLVEKIIANMNIVLKQIIPGLTIGVKDLGSEAMENGEIGSRIQLMSLRKGSEIALKYESEGIKKIISILQLLIVVYNQPITVAVDELDAGVFEYLLGELLRIISEKGRGQLIFTSHNLRPLETLDRGFIAFTTTNPSHRYVRMSKVKENNNLRDFYYRDIMLGEQNEELYETTNNSEIALAFREAGDYSGA